MKRMIFYHPAPLSDRPQSGSQVRPIKMLAAFRALGYDVSVICGSLAQRVQRLNALLSQLTDHTLSEYDFLYAESSTAPPIVRDKTLNLVAALRDLSIFKHLRKHNIPIGLFYRDIYWRFEHYKKNIDWHKRMVMEPLFRYELHLYNRVLDYIFLPSIKMIKAFPTTWTLDRVASLPPACDLPDLEPIHTMPTQPMTPSLGLLYVGGIQPPMYDIRPVLRVVRELPNVNLMIVCRSKEWTAYGDMYRPLLAANMQVVHVHGTELAGLYQQAEVSLLYFMPDKYRDFAVPVKMFEAIGYGKPVIASSGTAVATFVERESAGWVATSQEQLAQLLVQLRDNPDQVRARQNHVRQLRTRHTWEARAHRVAELLTTVRVNREALDG